MNTNKEKYYPTILQAAHLVVLYIFIQTIIDFPLALIDYYKDTEYLYHPIKKIVLGIGSVLFILWYGLRKAKNKISEVFPMKFFNPLIIIPIIIFLVADHILLDEINAHVERLIPPPPWFFELFNSIFESDYGMLGAFLKVAIVAPIVEELIFRGIIMHGLMRNYPKFIAVFFSALLFALFHLNPWQFTPTLILGLLLGWVMVRTRNIFLSILIHALNNGLVLITINYWADINSHAILLMEKTDLLKASGLTILLSLILIYLFSGKLSKTKKNTN